MEFSWTAINTGPVGHRSASTGWGVRVNHYGPDIPSQSGKVVTVVTRAGKATEVRLAGVVERRSYCTIYRVDPTYRSRKPRYGS